MYQWCMCLREPLTETQMVVDYTAWSVNMHVYIYNTVFKSTVRHTSHRQFYTYREICFYIIYIYIAILLNVVELLSV